MKRNLLFVLALTSVFCASADGKIITLDLSKATTALEFDKTTGAWSGTYDDDQESVESQCFSFVHSSMSEWQTWWGFTVSNSADNSPRDNYITYQFSNMAKGGIALNEDGSVKLDENGAPVVSAEIPYMVGYYSSYMAARPVDMTFNTGKSYEAVGVYVNLNSYTYYTVEGGDAYARSFTNGDRLTLTIHGVAADESEKEVVVTTASYDNGDLTINRGWRYVDLSSLGVVNELYFTIKSTDTGAYGDNTPAYFCLDKLMVRETASSGISDLSADGGKILGYDRESKIVTVSGADFAVVYDATGRKMMATDSAEFSIESLPSGVYVVRAGSASLKIAK